MDDALAQWQLLLDPAQCLLPESLDAAIRAAAAGHATGGAAAAAGVSRLVELARELRLL
jgi:HPt (histidine-containing phosphotransfer) domain-containing protein